MAELILALDLPTREEALRLLDRLPRLRWVKVGSILMTAEGPPLVRELIARGLKVFLDLKWHDIPNTVSGAVAAAGRLGIQMATVHIAGGDRMMRAAAATAGESLALVGVTVLTSRPLGAAGEEPVVGLARSAMDAGLAGVVCSPLEIGPVRRAIGPAPLIVVPGIRRAEDARGDQARVAGPTDAVRWGASHLVVGRPILEAPDPVRALEEFLGEMS